MSLGGSYEDFDLLQFQDDLSHELQQNGSFLTATVTIEAVDGKTSYFTKTGKAVSQKKTKRGQAKVYNERSYERRLLEFEYTTTSELLDDVDIMNMVRNPSSEAAQSMVWEIGRERDKIIFTALSGDATKQENGTASTVSLPSGQTVAVNSYKFDPAGGSLDIGLTPSKLKEAIKILKAAHVDVMREPVFVVGSANQLMKLTGQSEVTSSDFRAMRTLEIPGLVPGLQGYLGLNFIAYEEIDVDSNGDELVYVYPKSAVKMGIRKPLSVSIGPDYTRVGNPDTIEVSEDVGAVRMYEEKVVKIICDPNNLAST